jgi:RNA recognition motif-containing protein
MKFHVLIFFLSISLRTITCEGFPVDMKSDELENIFKDFSLEKVEIQFNKFGVSLRRAKVTFKERSDRQAALVAFVDNIMYNDCLIIIKPTY